MTPIIDIPSATTTLSAIGAWSSPMFDEFLPIGEIIIGVAVGVAIVSIIIRAVTDAFGHRAAWRSHDYWKYRPDPSKGERMGVSDFD